MTLPLATVVRPQAIPQLGTSTAEDSAITTMIAQADAVLAEWCGFPPASASVDPTLESTTYTHYLDGPSPRDARLIRLPVRPVASITSIHDDQDRDWTYDADDLVDSGDYTLDGVDGTVWLHDDAAHGTAWGAGRRVLKVIYVAGYDTGADARITRAIVALVAHWWAQRSMAGQTSVTLTDTTITAADRMIPAHVREMLTGIRMWEAGIG